MSEGTGEVQNAQAGFFRESLTKGPSGKDSATQAGMKLELKKRMLLLTITGTIATTRQVSPRFVCVDTTVGDVCVVCKIPFLYHSNA